MKYIIQYKGEIEVEAESPDKAKLESEPILKKIEEAGCRVSEAKVVHKDTGYFIS